MTQAEVVALPMDELEIDASRSRSLLGELPGLKVALDGAAMRPRLQRALVGSGHVIERCRPHKTLYLPGEGCIVRYELGIRPRAGGPSRSYLVGGRLFPDCRASSAFLRARLAPLVALAEGREELADFARPVCVLDPLPMVAYAFPIDPELPTLVGATDSRGMLGLFRALLSAEGLAVERCRVEVAHYPRWDRCVLRYELEGTQSGSGDRAPRTVYGRVAADAPAMDAAAAALREQLLGSFLGRLRMPRLLAFRPELSLSLVSTIPGVPRVGELVAARLGAGPAPETTLTLEGAVDTCARIAAVLHSADIKAGVLRSLDDELEALRPELSALRRISPELGAQLDDWTARLGADVATLEPLPPVFCHGDYTPAQVVFEGADSGLLDFDTLCQAEATLDLGQFSAYLRVACRKAERASSSAPAALGDELCERFLHTYVDASGTLLEAEACVLGRSRAYEAVSLVRMAVRSWRQLKPARTADVMSVLEERMACLPELVR